MSIIKTTIAGDSFGSLVHVDADVDPVRQEVKKAIAGFLAGYTGQTMTSYRVDLKKWVEWPDEARIGVFDAERAPSQPPSVSTATNSAATSSKRDLKVVAITRSRACWR